LSVPTDYYEISVACSSIKVEDPFHYVWNSRQLFWF